MTQPENFTAAQASDPQTPGQVLADIAALRPDLRAAVASNPSTYPGLLEWLKSLGEPAVDAAIAARPAAGQVTQRMPVQPPLAPPGVQVPPAPAWAGQANQGAPAYAYPPQGMPPQGMPPQGMPPGGYGPGAPAPRASNKTALWVILGIVALIILLTVGAVIFFINKARDVVEEIDDTIDITGDAETYGDDAALDALWDACETEDWEACDSLYLESPVGSEYESFGDTCGGRWEAGTTTLCVDALGGGATTTEPYTYGDDVAFDALWDACTGEDWQACDDLYTQSPVDSEYEAYGDTCGNKYAADTTDFCVDVMP